MLIQCFDLLLWLVLSRVGGTAESAVSLLLEVVVSVDSAGTDSCVSQEADCSTKCEKTLKFHF